MDVNVTFNIIYIFRLLKYFFNCFLKILGWFWFTVLATAKLTSFSFLLKDEDAYFRERKRIFQRTKTHISENKDAKKNKNAKKTKTQKNANAKKTKTHKNEDAKKRIFIGALYKSLQIITSSVI